MTTKLYGKDVFLIRAALDIAKDEVPESTFRAAVCELFERLFGNGTPSDEDQVVPFLGIRERGTLADALVLALVAAQVGNQGGEHNELIDGFDNLLGRVCGPANDKNKIIANALNVLSVMKGKKPAFTGEEVFCWR